MDVETAEVNFSGPENEYRDIINYDNGSLDAFIAEMVAKEMEAKEKSLPNVDIFDSVVLTSDADLADFMNNIMEKEHISLASSDVARAAPSQSEISLDCSQAGLVTQLKSFKTQLDQQQQLISELKEQVNVLKATQMNPQQSLKEAQQIQVDQVAPHIDFDAEETVDEKVLKSTQTQQCDQRSINMQSEDDAVSMALAHQSDKPSHPKATFPKHNFRKPEVLLRKLQVALTRMNKGNDNENTRRRSARNMNLAHELEDAPKFRKARHTDDKPHTCKVCRKGFTRRGHLKTHLRIHTGEKPFVCETCTKSFTSKSNLNVHSRIHTGVKPFVCETCTKSFNQQGVLKVHSRIHTGEKPYMCKICSKSFRHKVTLSRHLKVHAED